MIRVTLSHAAVAEQADARDLKSLGGNTVPVRPRSAAPKSRSRKWAGFLLITSSLFTKIHIWDFWKVKGNHEQ